MAGDQKGTPDPLAQLGTPAVPNPAPSDPLAAIGTPATPPAASAAPPAQASLGDRVIAGAKDFAAPVMSLVRDPETPTEQVLHAIGGGGGALAAYRMAKGLMEGAERVVKSTPGEFKQAATDYKRLVDDWHNKDYRNAISSAVSTGSHILGAQPGMGQIASEIREDSEGARPGGDLARPLTRQVLGAATALAGGEALSEEEAASSAASSAATKLKVNPFRQIMEGKAIAQEPAVAAVTGGVEDAAAGAGVPKPAGLPSGNLIEGSQSVLDEPLGSIASKEKAAYKQIDDTVGFDLKETKMQLKNDQYALKQLGNTEADQLTRKSLAKSIVDNTERIRVAEAKLTKAGLDPKAGDVVHTTRMAGEDFKNTIVKNTASDGTVNVTKLLNDSKALRFSKRGDRLAQFMGKDAADTYMNGLEAAQKAGVHAMKLQKIAKWTGGIAATALGLGAVGAGIKEGASLLAE